VGSYAYVDRNNRICPEECEVKKMDTDSFIVICPKCGAKNRIPGGRADKKAFCGKCHVPIGSAKPRIHPISASDANFSNEVLNSPGAVLVDFWAPWCGPCRTVAPILDNLAVKYAGRLKVVKVNVDENPVTASRYGIRSIPSIVLFKKGNVIKSIIGAQPQEELERHLVEVLT
jgi:thioredoxin 2